jgi:hypothetical protein
MVGSLGMVRATLPWIDRPLVRPDQGGYVHSQVATCICFLRHRTDSSSITSRDHALCLCAVYLSGDEMIAGIITVLLPPFPSLLC